MKYAMTCTCGEVIDVDADNKDDAVAKIKGIMNADMVKKHMAEKHAGEPVPSQDQVHTMVEQGTKEVN